MKHALTHMQYRSAVICETLSSNLCKGRLVPYLYLFIFSSFFVASYQHDITQGETPSEETFLSRVDVLTGIIHLVGSQHCTEHNCKNRNQGGRLFQVFQT